MTTFKEDLTEAAQTYTDSRKTLADLVAQVIPQYLEYSNILHPGNRVPNSASQFWFDSVDYEEEGPEVCFESPDDYICIPLAFALDAEGHLERAKVEHAEKIARRRQQNRAFLTNRIVGLEQQLADTRAELDTILTEG
jgi:hypothetical protein